MPIRMTPVKFKGKESKKYINSGGFKYDVVTKGVVHVYEDFLEHFLGKTIEEAEATYKEFAKILNQAAYFFSLKSGLAKTDLFGEALIGLARAKRDFDPKRSSNFKVFAIYKIKDALNEYIKNFSTPVTIPGYINRARSNLSKIKDLLKSKDLTVNDILYENKQIPNDIKDSCSGLIMLLNKEAKRSKISLETLVKRVEIAPYGRAENNINVQDNNRQEEQMYAKIVVENLRNHMTETELAITNMIMEGKSLRDIGKEFNKSHVWVATQLEKMRSRLKGKLKSIEEEIG